MTASSLCHDDVSKLLADPSPQARVSAAEKIAASFARGDFSERERQIAEQIFRIMLSDAEVRVREALSSNLKEDSTIPHDVAIGLANDVAEVSIPLLAFSDVLTDEDLLEVIRSQDELKQIAISGRVLVSEIVSTSLIETNNEKVVSRLIENEGAQISDASFETAVQDLGQSEMVQHAMINRSKLPVRVTEKLVTLVSDFMRDELLKRHQMSEDIASDLLLNSRERATVTLATGASAGELRKLVRQLRQNQRLTASLILRSLCMGDLRFFEAALSERANIPLTNTRTLIYDPGLTGLERLWIAGNLPAAQLDVVHAALQAASELEHDGEAQDRERFSRQLIERILTQFDKKGMDLQSDDLEYLLGKMSELPANHHPVD